MNRKTTTSIIGMLVLGGLISVAYASTTIITDTGITTTNLTILGTCTGCGEGSYNNYNTIQLNQTIPSIPSFVAAPSLFISNNGTVTWDNAGSFVITKTGLIIQRGNSGGLNPTFENTQSMTGIYKLLHLTNGTGSFIVIKNEAILQTLGINGNQFNGGINSLTDAISPNRQYIVFGYKDSGNALERILIFKGS